MNKLLSVKPKLFLAIVLLLVAVFLPEKFYAQTTLSTGDVVFTSYNADSDGDTFAIMILTGISANTEIIFTDGCYKDSIGVFSYSLGATPPAHTDWFLKWTATSAMPAFSQVKFWNQGGGCANNCTPFASTGSVSFGGANGMGLVLSITGDQIFAFQGGSFDTSSNTVQANRKYTPGTLLGAIHMNYQAGLTSASNWDHGTAISTAASELPNSLTNGTNAMHIDSSGVEMDNGKYNCTSVSGSAATVRSAANNVSNWAYNNNAAYDPTVCNSTWNGTDWSAGSPMSLIDAVIASSTTPSSFTSEDVTINSGFTLTLNSGATATIAGDLTNSGTGTSGVGTLRFVKSGTQSLAGTAFTHSGVVEVATGATLTTNSKLTLANNASLMHGGTGTTTPNGGGAVSGNITIQKTIGSSTFGWRSFGLPVDMLVDNFENGLNTRCTNSAPSDRWNVYYWDAAVRGGSTNNVAVGWTAANGTTDDENKAYAIFLSNSSSGFFDFSSTVDVTGTPNEGTKTFNLGYTFDPAGDSTTAVQRGWNLIPNYFPSNLSVYNLINDANFVPAYKAVHIWDQSVKQMRALNQSSIQNYNTAGGSVFSTIRQIPPFMAFWVKADAASQSIQVKNAHRTSRTDSLPANTYLKNDFDIFRVTVKDKEGELDQFSVCFDPGATEEMDYTMDIYKFESMSTEVPTLYSIYNGEKLSLAALPVKESYTMPLYIKSYTNGKEYTFSPEISQYSNYYDVEVVDNKTGVKTQLLTNNYTFSYDAAFKGPRFTLNFTRKASVSVNELFNQEKMYAYTNESGISVVYNNNNAQARAGIEVYNVLGQKLFAQSGVNGGETVTFKPAANGSTQVYFVNITSDGKTKTVKVVY